MTESSTPEEEAQRLITQADVAAAKRAWAKGDKSEPTTAYRAFAAQAAGTAADTRILDPNTAHSDPVKSLKVMIQRLREFRDSDAHGGRFRRMWEVLDSEYKENVMHDGVEGLPRWRGDTAALGPDCAVEGSIAPEMNARDLALPSSDRRSLPALLDSVVSEELHDQFRMDNFFFQPLIAQGKAKPPRAPDRSFVTLVGGDEMGVCMQCTAPPYPPSRNPMFKRLYEMGGVVDQWVWELILNRRYALITICASVVDEWLQEVVGGKDLFASIALLGCAKCGRQTRAGDESKPVMMCARCGGLGYCSQECQTADWERHKPLCKKKGKGKKRPTSKRQQGER